MIIYYFKKLEIQVLLLFLKSKPIKQVNYTFLKVKNGSYSKHFEYLESRTFQ